MTVEECSLQAGCLFLFLLQLDLKTHEALAGSSPTHTHTHSCMSMARPFERSPEVGPAVGGLPRYHEDVGLSKEAVTLPNTS